MNKRTASTRHPTMFRGAHYKKAINNQERGVYFSTCNQEHIETLAQIHSGSNTRRAGGLQQKIFTPRPKFTKSDRKHSKIATTCKILQKMGQQVIKS